MLGILDLCIYIESGNIWLYLGINIPNINLMYLTLISDIIDIVI